MTYRVLGLDPSTTMGIVVLEYDHPTINTILAREFVAKGKDMARLGSIGGEVIRLIEVWEPDVIWIEGYSFGSKFNHEIMYSIGTVIRYFLWQSGFDRNTIQPTSLKKFATGKGGGKKELMMKEIFKFWGFDTSSNNVADAYAIALFGLYHHLSIVSEKGVWSTKDKKKFEYLHFGK